MKAIGDVFLSPASHIAGIRPTTSRSHMNLGITELIFVCGIVGLLLLITAMVSGIGLRFLRREKLAAEKHDPLEILRARYARGEITREQFEQMKQDLA